MSARTLVFSAFLAGCGGLDALPLDGKPDAAIPFDARALPDTLATDDAPPAKPAVEERVPVAAGLASWVLPRADLTGDRRTAFLMPWPSDVARTARGKIDLTFMPGAGTPTILGQYVTLFTDRLDGFSTVGAAYLRFGSAVDPASLPASADASRRDASSVQLVDVDPASPDHGRRLPLQWYVRDTPTRYWHSNTLAVAPATGFPLRPRTRYAVVVTRDLRARDGRPLTRDRDLDAVLAPAAAGEDAAVTAARAVFTPALDELAAVGVTRERILSVTTFTTLDPGAEFFRAADWLRTAGPTPALADLGPVFDLGYADSVIGHYGPNPVFQAGPPPYGVMGSGGFVLDAAGVPQVQRTETLRFALTIPRGPMPARGWPLAIYAHGTGGDFQSFIMDRTAEAAANEGVAMLGFDQVFHGERATMGTSPDTAFFNFLNPEAGRTNNLQAALDLIQCGRFARVLSVPMTRNGEAVTARFDPARLMFFGHSQGGLNGPLWLAAEDAAHAAVLSGAGGAFNVSLLLKTSPVNIPAIITSILALAPRELVSLHPAVTLLQLMVDPSDPVNYGRYLVREPRQGLRAKHVFQTQGFIDTFAPPEGIAALARSIALPLVDPVLHRDPLFDLTGLGTTLLPARSNVVLGRGASVTGAWMQFDAPRGRDGHFVVFSVPGARLRAASFLGSAGRDPDGIPTVPSMTE